MLHIRLSALFALPMKRVVRGSKLQCLIIALVIVVLLPLSLHLQSQPSQSSHQSTRANPKLTHHHLDPIDTGKELYRALRVLCVFPSRPNSSHGNEDNWSSKCSGSQALEARNFLEVVQMVYSEHMFQFDWFLISDSDQLSLDLDQLRQSLLSINTNMIRYVFTVEQGHPGSQVFVLGRLAIKKIVEVRDSSQCTRTGDNMLDFRNCIVAAGSVLSKLPSESNMIDAEAATEKEVSSEILPLHKGLRILCFVLTYKGAFQSQAIFVKQTWAKRCAKTIYISNEDDADFPAVGMGADDPDDTGHKQLWRKTRGAAELVYREYLLQYDWFLKADDDTYVIIENLQKFLLNKNTDTDTEYYGRAFFTKWGNFNSGGAGYVFGRLALKRLYEVSLNRKPSSNCPGPAHRYPEDLLMGKCMKQAGIQVSTNSVDRNGLELFHSLSLISENSEFLLGMKYQMPTLEWYMEYSPRKLRNGFQCCSPDSISYHYVHHEQMLLLEYIFYHISKIQND